MTALSQTTVNDIFLTSEGDFAMSGGKEACANVIADVVRTYRGELQLDTGMGVPYFETVFDSVNGIDVWKSEVRKSVLALPFVRSIDSFSASWNTENHILSYSMTVSTDSGTVTISQ